MRKAAGIAALTVLVLASAGAMADESVQSGTISDGGIVYVIGGAARPPADDAESGTPVWTDLRQLLSDATITFGAAPLAGDLGGSAEDGYNAYADVELEGFRIGGRFSQWTDLGDSGQTSQSFGFGASYRLESLTVGVDWSRGNFDEQFLDIGGDDAGDVIAFTSSYALSPGVRVNGLLEYSEQKPAEPGPDENAFTVGIGTLINF